MHGGSSTTYPYLNEDKCPIWFETPSKMAMDAREIDSSYAPSKARSGVVICDREPYVYVQKQAKREDEMTK